MDDYFSKLFLAPLPCPVWAVALAWLVAHGIFLVLTRRLRKLTDAEEGIVVPASARPSLQPRVLAAHFAVSLGVMAISCVAGGAWASYLAGGWFVAVAANVATNARTVLMLRSRAKPGALTGQVEISSAALWVERAANQWGMALWCLLLVLVVPHPALLGGTYLLAVGGQHAWRQSRRSPAVAATAAA